MGIRVHWQSFNWYVFNCDREEKKRKLGFHTIKTFLFLWIEMRCSQQKGKIEIQTHRVYLEFYFESIELNVLTAKLTVFKRWQKKLQTDTPLKIKNYRRHVAKIQQKCFFFRRNWFWFKKAGFKPEKVVINWISLYIDSYVLLQKRNSNLFSEEKSKMRSVLRICENLLCKRFERKNQHSNKIWWKSTGLFCFLFTIIWRGSKNVGAPSSEK